MPADCGPDPNPPDHVWVQSQNSVSELMGVCKRPGQKERKGIAWEGWRSRGPTGKRAGEPPAARLCSAAGFASSARSQPQESKSPGPCGAQCPPATSTPADPVPGAPPWPGGRVSVRAGLPSVDPPPARAPTPGGVPAGPSRLPRQPRRRDRGRDRGEPASARNPRRAQRGARSAVPSAGRRGSARLGFPAPPACAGDRHARPLCGGRPAVKKLKSCRKGFSLRLCHILTFY